MGKYDKWQHGDLVDFAEGAEEDIISLREELAAANARIAKLEAQVARKDDAIVYAVRTILDDFGNDVTQVTA